MSRFIRCGQHYINMSNILRWEINQVSEQKWQASMTMREHKSHGFMVGSTFFGMGWSDGKQKTCNWTFQSEDQAHQFVQSKLKPALEDV